MISPRKQRRIRSIVVFLIGIGIAASACQGWNSFAAHRRGGRGAGYGYVGGAAQDWLPYGGGYGLGARLPDLDKLPYFSLFPPVYYSNPVPRTYGYTPFASLPELTTILETRSAQPLVVQNPYVTAPAVGASPEVSSAQTPQIVRNPFVSPSKDGIDPGAKLAGK
jgi:hypothetical protein